MSLPASLLEKAAMRAHGGSITTGDRTARCFSSAFGKAKEASYPFRHWLIDQPLPGDVARATAALPFAVPEVTDTLGRRETHNASRIFFSAENRAEYPVCNEIAAAFQSPQVVSAIGSRTGVDFRGSFLRIEFCQDTAGFYLEPHTDIGAKLMTMLIYLSDHPDSEAWGTDFYNVDGSHACRIRAPFNSAYLFVPGTDTLHGFEARPIHGVRKTVIVNYVKPEWRSRNELAYPDRPV